MLKKNSSSSNSWQVFFLTFMFFVQIYLEILLNYYLFITHSLTHSHTHSLIGPIVPEFFFRTTVNYTRNTLGASACEYHLSPAAWDLIMYLSGYYPVTCLVWECLPEAEAFTSIALWVVGSHKPHRQYKAENFEGNENMFKM